MFSLYKTNRSARTVAAMVVLSVAAAGLSAAPASANESTTAEETLQKSFEVAPHETLVSENQLNLSEYAISTETGTGEITIPLAAEGNPIVVEDQSKDSLEFALPEELTLEDAQVVDGSAVFLAENTEDAVVVQALEGERVRIQTVTASPESPHRFTYRLADGQQPIIQDDGSVDLVNEYGGFSVVSGHVELPWARDAQGENVKTFFVVEDGALVQVIEPSANAVYPIVADPTFGHTYGVPTMYFNKAETLAADTTPEATLFCAAAATFSKIASLVCAVGTYNIVKASQKAVKEKKCAKFLLGPGTVVGLSYSCKW